MHDARRKAGLDQKTVAKTLGIGQSTLSELEREAKGSSHVVAFAALYRVSAHWLATGDGSETGGDALSPEAIKIAQAYERMNPGERHRLRLLILAARDGVNPSNITSPNQGEGSETGSALDLDSGLGELAPENLKPKRRS